MSTPEVQPGSSREVGGHELAVEAAERSEKLAKSREKEPLDNAERATEARAEASREALFSKEASVEDREARAHAGSTTPQRETLDRRKSYQHTMNTIQKDMPAPVRAFSHFVHHPIVEKTSQAIGSTVARPNALLAGSFTAFVTVAIVYVIARRYGYPLSGFETIGAFVIGWALGVIYDYARIALRRR